MPREPHKRPAGEVITALQAPAETSVPGPTPPRRPAGVVLGVVFILLRATGGLLWMAEAAGSWNDLRHDIIPGGHTALYVVVTVHGVWTTVLLVLAWQLWRGRDSVRLAVLLWTTVNIVLAAVGYYVHGERITVHTSLLTLALDILVLLALSGSDARTWTRAATAARRRRK